MAQKARREFWKRGGMKFKEDVERYRGKVNNAFKENEMSEAEAKERFLSDFESDSGLAKDAEPLRDLIWNNRDVFGDADKRWDHQLRGRVRLYCRQPGTTKIHESGTCQERSFEALLRNL
jgi:hypothetical protein